jgi:hypothetical protein
MKTKRLRSDIACNTQTGKKLRVAGIGYASQPPGFSLLLCTYMLPKLRDHATSDQYHPTALQGRFELQRVFPEIKLRGLVPNFHFHTS